MRIAFYFSMRHWDCLKRMCLDLFEIPDSIVANNNDTDFSAKIAKDTHTLMYVRIHWQALF